MDPVADTVPGPCRAAAAATTVTAAAVVELLLCILLGVLLLRTFEEDGDDERGHFVSVQRARVGDVKLEEALAHRFLMLLLLLEVRIDYACTTRPHLSRVQRAEQACRA